MIAVVDYRKGNLKSVERGLAAAGADARITDDEATIARARAIVLPGVGAFADAAATMRELGQLAVIRERIAAGVPFLGICLGMHLLFEEGEEGAPGGAPRPRGLGVLPGVVDRLPATDAAGRTFKIPHVGWNTVELPGSSDSGASEPETRFSCPILADAEPGTYFYFTHSYAVPEGPYTVATTEHSVRFPSAVQYGEAVFGVQFHPEKSSDAGARVLRAFVRIAKEA